MKKFKYIIATLFVVACFTNKSYATYTLTVNELWNNPDTKNEDIVIPNGITLQITSKIQFSSNCSIIVEVGGTLYVDGGTLTSINSNELWHGIVAKGNRAVNQRFIPVINQSKVTLYNAVIENAEYGVFVGTNSTSTNYMYYDGGGMVFATNTIFRNNYESVHFNTYVYKDPNSADAERDNVSSFTNCDFIVNNYVDNVPIAMVVLNGVKGIHFTHCDFITTLPVQYAIYSTMSSVYINQSAIEEDWQSMTYWLTTPCNFQGFLEAAIFLDNSQTRNSIITTCNFTDNSIGIYARNTNFLRIESSTFNLNENMGIIIDKSSTAFKIENNIFNCLNTTGNSGIGIMFYGKVYDNNFIRYNNFTNLCAANDIIGVYGNSANNAYAEGLQFHCNIYSHNNDDINIFNNANIRLLQGTQYIGAGNHFVPTVSNFNIYNNTNNLNIVVYYRQPTVVYQDPTSILGKVTIENSISVPCVTPGYKGASYYPNPFVIPANRVDEWENNFNDFQNSFGTLLVEYQNNYGDGSINWKEYYEGDDSYQQQVEDFTELTTLKESMDFICQEAIYYYLQLENGDNSQLKLWVSRMGTAQMDFHLAEYYLSENNGFVMDSILNTMAVKYPYYDPDDISNYKICLDYLLNWNISNSDSVYISPSTIDSLQSIANGTDASADIARSILSIILHDFDQTNIAYFCWNHTMGNSNAPVSNLSVKDKENESFNLSVKPNPTNDKVTVSINNDMIINEVILYDLYGKKLWNENINNSMLSIDMSTYCKGVYFISCKLNNGKTIIRKIIKK